MKDKHRCVTYAMAYKWLEMAENRLDLEDVGYDRNQIVWPETGTELEFRFWLTGTGMAF